MAAVKIKEKVFGFGDKMKGVKDKIKSEVDRNIKKVKDVDVKNKIKSGFESNVRKVKNTVVKKKGNQVSSAEQ